jgi:hypothetical protein
MSLKIIEGIPCMQMGVKYFDPEEPFGYNWWLFRDEDIKQDAIKNGYNEYTDEDLVHVLGLQGYYQGPGMPFSNKAYVRRVGKRVLVVQRWGWDI